MKVSYKYIIQDIEKLSLDFDQIKVEFVHSSVCVVPEEVIIAVPQPIELNCFPLILFSTSLYSTPPYFSLP